MAGVGGAPGELGGDTDKAPQTDGWPAIGRHFQQELGLN